MYFCVLCIVCFVTFPVLFVCICVLNNCHRVATHLQLNISYHNIIQGDVFELILCIMKKVSKLFYRYCIHIDCVVICKWV
jgi:hypothetical protein